MVVSYVKKKYLIWEHLCEKMLARWNQSCGSMHCKRARTCSVNFSSINCLYFFFLQDGSITIAANEAKDNVRYLYILDKFFGPLAKASPVSSSLKAVV